MTLSDTVLDILRRELRRVSPDIRIETAEIRNTVLLEVLKREVVDGEKAEAARKLVSKAAGRTLRGVRAEFAESKDDRPAVVEPALATFAVKPSVPE